MPDAADTAARSLAHWSEASRREMEAFYALARLDYAVLAQALDVGAWLAGALERRPQQTADEPHVVRVLDVACGSGKFPEALLAQGDLAPLTKAGVTVALDLLDPSPFSLTEAASVLRAPFAAGAHHETTIEDLDPAVGPFDAVWATHALYAVEPGALDAAAARTLAAIAPHGVGLIAHGAADGHYLAFYDAFLRGVRDGEGTPYRSSEDVAQALRTAGAGERLTVRRLAYDHHVAAEDRATLEGYLQRCAFDDTTSLEQMLDAPVLGDYLRSCRQPDGSHVFHQEVDLLLLAPSTEATA